MKALVLERTPSVSRRVARLWRTAGYDVTIHTKGEAVLADLEEVRLIGAEDFDRAVVLKALERSPSAYASLFTAESLQRHASTWIEQSRLLSILGRPDFESPPPDRDILMAARIAATAEVSLPPIEVHLNWGAMSLMERVTSTNDLEAVVIRVRAMLHDIGLPAWLSDTAHELTHELLMNAVYDAPVDAAGRPRFAHDRKGDVRLERGEAPRIHAATDGSTLCVEVTDVFGRLTKRQVLEGLHRGLGEGELDPSGGGAGLGMAVCNRSSTSLVYDLVPGSHTTVRAFLDLDLNRKTLRSAGRSLHFVPRSS